MEKKVPTVLELELTQWPLPWSRYISKSGKGEESSYDYRARLIYMHFYLSQKTAMPWTHAEDPWEVSL